MKIGDRIFVRGYIDEIRKDTVIVRNDGGYFGTVPSEVITGELPSAQPEQWIPCSETIDIPDHEVLCRDEYGEELIGWLSYSDDQWLCESDDEMMYDPIAWREKPEPWRGEE